MGMLKFQMSLPIQHAWIYVLIIKNLNSMCVSPKLFLVNFCTGQAVGVYSCMWRIASGTQICKRYPQLVGLITRRQAPPRICTCCPIGSVSLAKLVLRWMFYELITLLSSIYQAACFQANTTLLVRSAVDMSSTLAITWRRYTGGASFILAGKTRASPVRRSRFV
jgi:hypothetical protein